MVPSIGDDAVMSALRTNHHWVSVAVIAILGLGLTVGIVASTTAPKPQVSTLPTVPHIVGLSVIAGEDRLNIAGLGYRLEVHAPSPGQQIGTILTQSPPAGTVIGERARVVTFTFASTGTPGAP